ncbi:hypothetical protein [Amycolatopsis jejuensis]|uniref:hypothetical protein n=1 Tax=Amycolatopsis jejuensis TaxID=330084 RepID=UPI000691640D|nr:hypothetical protein [Amycolatopsis jejuensis]
MTLPGVRALIGELDAAGDLPAAFGPLLDAIPREQFIPDRAAVDRVPIDRGTDPQAWLAAVYSDRSIVTQFDDGRTPWPDVDDRPTSSASQPSVVLGMLDALQVTEGLDILEIDTGTGYNAALLRHLVGPTGSVTTIDIDPDVTGHAAARLTAAGFGDVDVLTQGGAISAASGGEGRSFDRVIATMAVPLGRIPHAWVAQCRVGGQILTRSAPTCAAARWSVSTSPNRATRPDMPCR